MAKIDPDTFLRLMTSRGINKTELANQTGLARGTIQSAAKGEPCHRSTLEKVAKALGVSETELSGGVAPASES